MRQTWTRKSGNKRKIWKCRPFEIFLSTTLFFPLSMSTMMWAFFWESKDTRESHATSIRFQLCQRILQWEKPQGPVNIKGLSHEKKNTLEYSLLLELSFSQKLFPAKIPLPKKGLAVVRGCSFLQLHTCSFFYHCLMFDLSWIFSCLI